MELSCKVIGRLQASKVMVTTGSGLTGPREGWGPVLIVVTGIEVKPFSNKEW